MTNEKEEVWGRNEIGFFVHFKLVKQCKVFFCGGGDYVINLEMLVTPGKGMNPIIFFLAMSK